jgi:hypothetical protein
MDLLKTSLLDGNPLEVQGTTFETFPFSPLLIVPRIETPSVQFNFAAGRQLDSRITFTRGSTGTFINSSGLVESAASGVARFTHDPVTLASLGLLIEESRTNLIKQGSSIGTTPWLAQASATISTNQATSPEGASTASLATLTSNSNSAIYQENVNSTSGTYTLSIWVRVSSGTSNFFMASYSAADGVVYSSQFTATTTWQRFTWTRTVTAISNWYPLITNTASGGSFLVWGGQLEAGSFALSYIPTTTATVTRAADLAEITSTNFSSWFNSGGGTLVAEGVLGTTSGSRRMFTFGGSTLGVGTRVNGSTSSIIWRTPTNYDASTGTVSAGAIKQAFSYAPSLLSGVVNGGTIATNTPPSSLPATSANVGSSETGFDYWNGTIARVRYFPRRITDANLQLLTK